MEENTGTRREMETSGRGARSVSLNLVQSDLLGLDDECQALAKEPAQREVSAHVIETWVTAVAPHGPQLAFVVQTPDRRRARGDVRTEKFFGRRAHVLVAAVVREDRERKERGKCGKSENGNGSGPVIALT